MVIVLFLASTLFWSGFEQASTFFNLFAREHTVRSYGWLSKLLGQPGYAIPASWFQSINPIFVILFAPFMAWLWVRLALRNLNPSMPVKFGFGLLLLAGAFSVMAGASVLVAAGQKVWPTWLITIYLFNTFGELCLSPVGLSSVTKLAPARMVGQMLGAWFVASSLGNLLAGMIAGGFGKNNLQDWPALCRPMIFLPVVLGLLLIACYRPIKRLMGGVT